MKFVAVMDMLEEKGFLPPEFVESETNWFYGSLGIDGPCKPCVYSTVGEKYD